MSCTFLGFMNTSGHLDQKSQNGNNSVTSSATVLCYHLSVCSPRASGLHSVSLVFPSPPACCLSPGPASYPSYTVLLNFLKLRSHSVSLCSGCHSEHRTHPWLGTPTVSHPYPASCPLPPSFSISRVCPASHTWTLAPYSHKGSLLAFNTSAKPSRSLTKQSFHQLPFLLQC